MQAYFGWAKACLLDRYDEAAIFDFMSEEDWQHGAFAIKTIRARPMKTPTLQARDLWVFFLQFFESFR